jgi:hypothetical protein
MMYSAAVTKVAMHGERVHHGVRHREHGAHPQQVDEDRVLLPQRIEKGGQLRGGRRALG